MPSSSACGASGSRARCAAATGACSASSPRIASSGPSRRFEDAYDPADPDPACRRLFIDLLWEQAVAKSASGLIEQSCDTIAQAPTLMRLFPEAKFVHIVRDGRDASASRVGQTRGLVYPRTRNQGIDWFEKRIRRIEAGARQIPDDSLFQVSLEDILTPPRHDAAQRCHPLRRCPLRPADAPLLLRQDGPTQREHGALARGHLGAKAELDRGALRAHAGEPGSRRGLLRSDPASRVRPPARARLRAAAQA